MRNVKKVFFFILLALTLVSILLYLSIPADEQLGWYVWVTLGCFAFYCLGYYYAIANIIPIIVQFYNAVIHGLVLSFSNMFSNSLSSKENSSMIFALALPVAGFIYAIICAVYRPKRTYKDRPDLSAPD